MVTPPRWPQMSYVMKIPVFRSNILHSVTYSSFQHAGIDTLLERLFISSTQPFREDSLFLGWGGATPSENPYNSCVNHHICPKDFLRVSLFYPRIPKYRRLKLFCPSPFATLGIIFAPLWLKIQKYPQPMKTLENIEFWWVEKIGQV